MKKSPRPQTLAIQIRKWRVHLDAQGNSGLSRAEYCRQHDLPYHAFGYRQRKLRRPESHPLTLVPLTLQPGPMQPTANSDLPALRLLLPGKIAMAVLARNIQRLGAVLRQQEQEAAGRKRGPCKKAA